MPRARRSKSAMRVRVSSTEHTAASSVHRRCGTSKCVGSPAPQWSATNNRADHSVRMVGYRITDWLLVNRPVGILLLMQPDQEVISAWRDSPPFWEKHRESIRQMFPPVTQALVEEALIGTGQTV